MRLFPLVYMEATLLTLKFDAKRGGFEKERIEDFCMNKKIHSVEGHFFQHENIPYWTVMIRFDRIAEKDPGIEGLSPEEKQAFEKLRAWRKERAEKEGYPPYLIATNKHLVRMIAKRVRNQEGLLGIKGFGRKRIQKYSQDILKILKTFFEYE